MNHLGDEEARYRAVLSIPLADASAPAQLVSALYDESWRVRRAALEQLSRLPRAEEAVESLAFVLADRGQTGARNAAAEALVRLGASAEAKVISLVSHADADQRKFAAEILGEMKCRSAVGPLAAALEDADLNVRAAAAEALGRIGGEEAARALERLLKESEPILRLCALEGLAALRRPPPLPLVAPLLEDSSLCRSAYRVLGLIAQPAAAELACRGLLSEIRSVREAALAALGSQRSMAAGQRRAELEAGVRAALRRLAGIRDTLSRALEGEELEAKAGALLAVGALRDWTLAAAVAEAARDPRLAEEVVRTLEKLGGAGGRELLSKMASLSTPAQAAAAEALSALADPSLVEPLTALAASAEPELASAALLALGRSRAPAAVEVLVLHLGDPQLAPTASRALVALAETFRAPVLEALLAEVERKPTPAGVWALARVGGGAALPILRRTSRDEDALLRAASADGAGEVGGEAGLELVRLALADEAAPVRRTAARALGRLGAAEAETLLRVALADEDGAVQATAIESAGTSGASSLAGQLAQMLESPDGLRALHAVRSLERLGRLTPEQLRRAARHPDSEVVKQALASGAAMADGAELARALLGHRQWDVRAAAARVLGASGGADCLESVRAALEREVDALAREALSDALSQLSHR
ncbi:MAG: HEAT repeat domain-containing protein [Myxococcales bacterium]|nr:HEAT repeat domain-containing protein [Myxococcales bacterium]